VNAHRARHLREPRNRFFHVVCVHHHQVRQFVDDDHQVGKRFVLALLHIFKERKRLLLLERPVVLIDISHAALRQ